MNNIPLYVHTIFSLSIHLLMGIWTVSTFWPNMITGVQKKRRRNAGLGLPTCRWEKYLENSYALNEWLGKRRWQSPSNTMPILFPKDLQVWGFNTSLLSYLNQSSHMPTCVSTADQRQTKSGPWFHLSSVSSLHVWGEGENTWRLTDPIFCVLGSLGLD